MDYGLIVYALAGVTLLGGMAWGVMTLIKAKRDQEKGRTSAFAESDKD